MTPIDQRHTQTVIGDHFSDIDEDEQEDEATSRFLDMGVDGEAQPPTGGVTVFALNTNNIDVGGVFLGV